MKTFECPYNDSTIDSKMAGVLVIEKLQLCFTKSRNYNTLLFKMNSLPIMRCFCSLGRCIFIVSILYALFYELSSNNEFHCIYKFGKQVV